MSTPTITTGELRSALQPVVFLHLTEAIRSTPEGRVVFDAGALVVAQYWGAGLVALTNTKGERRMVVAHDIHAAFATPPVEDQLPSE